MVYDILEWRAAVKELRYKIKLRGSEAPVISYGRSKIWWLYGYIVILLALITYEL